MARRDRRFEIPANATPGFGCAIKDDTELGSAILIVEDEEGHHEPIGVVVSINEAREVAASDLRGRLKELERDGDPGLCPYEYKVWARGVEGKYLTLARISATDRTLQ